MADTNAVTTNDGRSILLYRGNTDNVDLSSVLYLPLSQLKIGVNGSTPSVSDTTILHNVPISDGTALDDGSNALTGSNGADDSTDNIVTFKEGAGASDVTAQNLITTGSNVTKTWTIADLDTSGNDAVATQYTGLWFYIKDTAALDKFADTGTALEVKIGEDTSNYYSETWEDDDLAVGWNWLDMGVLNLNTETGTVTGDLDTFIIEITTNDAADAFVAGDVIYDLLRQWEASDLVKVFSDGYPSINHTTLTVTRQAVLTILEANGFLLDNFEWVNQDTAKLLGAVALTGGDSKSGSDQWKVIQKERLL